MRQRRRQDVVMFLLDGGARFSECVMVPTKFRQEPDNLVGNGVAKNSKMSPWR